MKAVIINPIIYLTFICVMGQVSGRLGPALPDSLGPRPLQADCVWQGKVGVEGLGGG